MVEETELLSVAPKQRVLLQNPIGCCATQPSHACRPMGGGGFGEVVGREKVLGEPNYVFGEVVDILET